MFLRWCPSCPLLVVGSVPQLLTSGPYPPVRCVCCPETTTTCALCVFERSCSCCVGAHLFMQMVFSRSHRLATLLLLCCVVCCTVWVGVNAQGNCACSCCIGNGCTPSNAGQTTVSIVTVKHRWYSVFRSTASFGYALHPGHRDRFIDTTAVFVIAGQFM